MPSKSVARRSCTRFATSTHRNTAALLNASPHAGTGSVAGTVRVISTSPARRASRGARGVAARRPGDGATSSGTHREGRRSSAARLKRGSTRLKPSILDSRTISPVRRADWTRVPGADASTSAARGGPISPRSPPGNEDGVLDF